MFRINWYWVLLVLYVQWYFASCESKNKSDEPRTYYGKELLPSDVPYMVGITIQDLLCTGAIITPDTVISAAQCFKTSEPKSVKLFIGSNQIKENGIYFEVRSIHIHPAYKAVPIFTVGAYDVAILKLTRKIPSHLGSPVSISTDTWDKNDPPKKCRIAGYGMHKSATISEQGIGRLHGSMQDVSRSADSCGCASLTREQRKNVICLGPKSTDRICFGDYGGAPMVCDKKLVALAHGQVGCSNFTVPVGDIMMCGYDNMVDIFLWIRPMLGFLAAHIPGLEDPEGTMNKGHNNFDAALLLYTIIFMQILFLFSLFSK